MRRTRKSIQKPEVVYALVSKKKKSFFIARGTRETLRETYRHNIKGRRDYTQHFIESISPERPCLFILEDIDPEDEANLLLVWLRILRENGYVSYNSQTLIEYSEELYYDNEVAYQKRKNTDLSRIFDCRNCLVPTYKKETCPHHFTYDPNQVTRKVSSAPKKSGTRSECIRFRVSEEECQTIRQKAAQENLSVAEYGRKVAMNPQIIQLDYSGIAEHTKHLKAINDSLDRIVFTIDAQKNYHKKDIDTVVNLMQEVYKSEVELLQKMRKKKSAKNS